jgi:hypothetical protein
MATFLSWAYNAVFYSHMVSPAFTKPIDTISDLIKSNAWWMSARESILEAAAQYEPLGRKAVYRDQLPPNSPSDYELIKKYPGRLIVCVEKNPLGIGTFDISSPYRQAIKVRVDWAVFIFRKNVSRKSVCGNTYGGVPKSLAIRFIIIE